MSSSDDEPENEIERLDTMAKGLVDRIMDHNASAIKGAHETARRLQQLQINAYKLAGMFGELVKLVAAQQVALTELSADLAITEWGLTGNESYVTEEEDEEEEGNDDEQQ